jgi:hypothetical protein
VSGSRAPTELLEMSAIPKYAAGLCGPRTHYWRRATRTHPIVHPAPLHKTASAHESSGQRPSGGNGWLIGGKAGQAPIGVTGGLTFVGVRRRQSTRTTSPLTQIVEIIDAKY